MIILHNKHSKKSRDFVEAHGAGNVVIDWYSGGREHYESCAGHKKVSTFPSVPIHVPAHRVLINGEIIEDIPACDEFAQNVSSLDDIQTKIDQINEVLADSELYGLAVDPIQWEDLSTHDNDYL